MLAAPCSCNIKTSLAFWASGSREAPKTEIAQNRPLYKLEVAMVKPEYCRPYPETLKNNHQVPNIQVAMSTDLHHLEVAMVEPRYLRHYPESYFRHYPKNNQQVLTIPLAMSTDLHHFEGELSKAEHHGA